jgi:hypothetical protein
VSVFSVEIDMPARVAISTFGSPRRLIRSSSHAPNSFHIAASSSLTGASVAAKFCEVNHCESSQFFADPSLQTCVSAGQWPFL